MNHKILAALLVAFGAGGTVSAIAVTNPGLIALQSSVNWCAGLEFSDGDKSLVVTNRNPEAIKIVAMRVESGFSQPVVTLQPLDSHSYPSGWLSGTYEAKTTLVARKEVKECSHTVTLTETLPPSESLSLESNQLASQSEFVLYLRNTGSVSVDLWNTTLGMLAERGLATPQSPVRGLWR